MKGCNCYTPSLASNIPPQTMSNLVQPAAITLRRRRSSVVRRGSLVGSLQSPVRRGSIVGSPARNGRRTSIAISQEDCALLHLAPSVQRFWQVTI